MSGLNTLRTAAIAVLLLAGLAACDEQAQGSAQQGSAEQGNAAPAAQAQHAVEVGVATVKPRDLPISVELPGRVTAYRTAEIRPQVDGIIRERMFREGGVVKAGQSLYRIDPKPYEATLASAKAALLRAQADVAATGAKARRYKTLLESNAVSRQNYDDAVAAMKQAEADVASAQASIDAAQINLGYTTVVSPITGRIGKSAVTEGALVTANQTTALAVVQQLDPIYVDMTQSLVQLTRMRRDLAAGAVAGHDSGHPPVTVIVDATGTALPDKGELLFSDVTVEEDTGSVQLRAEVPNPNEDLLPGMFVRARVDQGVRKGAILVPQQAVFRAVDGSPRVWLLDADDKVAPHQVETEKAIGNAWLVTAGLKAGDRVVVEGLQKIRPGAKVAAVPTTVKLALDR